MIEIKEFLQNLLISLTKNKQKQEKINQTNYLSQHMWFVSNIYFLDSHCRAVPN